MTPAATAWRSVFLVGAVLCTGMALPALAQDKVAVAADGAEIFGRICAACHQADGVGTIGLAPAIKGPHWQHLGARREYLPTVLLKGMAGSITVNGQMIVGNMPSFAGVLDDAALAAVANHLMELQGPQGRAPYTPEEMASVRQSKGDPGQTRKLRSQILPP